MAVPIRLDSAADNVEAAAPVRLFVAQVRTQPTRQQYVVSSDGQRFLLHMLIDQEGGYPITMILNWSDGSTTDAR